MKSCFSNLGPVSRYAGVSGAECISSCKTGRAFVGSAIRSELHLYLSVEAEQAYTMHIKPFLDQRDKEAQRYLSADAGTQHEAIMIPRDD